jgi:tetratricopeptide (TPR) repeat protein
VGRHSQTLCHHQQPGQQQQLLQLETRGTLATTTTSSSSKSKSKKMSGLRDLVGDAACEGGNPLMNAMNRLWEDPTARQRFELQQQQEQQGGGRLFDGRSEEELIHSHQGVETFFETGGQFTELDPDIDAFADFRNGARGSHLGRQQEGEMPGHMDHLLGHPMPSGAMPPHLQAGPYFKSPLDSHPHHQTMEGVHRAGVFRAGEGGKVRNRLGVMAHHFEADASDHLMHAQLGPSFEKMMIGDRPLSQHHAHTADAWAADFSEKESEAWAAEFNPEQMGHMEWLREFRQQSERPAVPWEEEFDKFDEHEFREFQNHWRQSEGEQWTNEFEQMKDQLSDRIAYSRYLDTLNDQQAQEELKHLGARISSIADPKMQRSKFVQLMSRIAQGQVTVEGDQLVENSLATATSPEPPGGMMSDLVNDWLGEYDDFEPSTAGQKGWDFADFEADDEISRMFNFGTWGGIRPYEFSPDNPFSDHPAPLLRGIELFDAGELSDAILAFEAAAQRDMQNNEIWRRLGEAHAENDRDDRAIAALTRATHIDAGDLPALMSLAVSCTNDSYRVQALRVLKNWLARNPRYHDHPLLSAPEFAQDIDTLDDESELHERVTEIYLEAARMSPHDPDPDVQIALGLLFNISQEYDKAVDCFRLALQKRPNDYALWNKLGATLANSNHSKEALAPYYRSLKIKPTYTRARANLGISYLNMEMYREAATQFLACLAIQPSAKHIWMSLQTVFSRMERDDLLERSLRYDIDAFRDEFDF